MFLRKKRTKENSGEEAFRRQLMEQLQGLTGMAKDTGEAVSALCSEIKQNGKEISRHGMALEDCLEMLDEIKKCHEQEQKQRRLLEQEQEKLLRLVAVYQEQMWNIKASTEDGHPLHHQLLLVERLLGESMLSCGITEVSGAGGPVNYAVHEVIEVIDTTDPRCDRTVAAIVKPGYLYRGTVRQKAKVAAYRLQAGRQDIPASVKQPENIEHIQEESI